MDFRCTSGKYMHPLVMKAVMDGCVMEVDFFIFTVIRGGNLGMASKICNFSVHKGVYCNWNR